jgi:predicted ArsR family transcriptional regulator
MTLAAIADSQVAAWKDRLAGKSLEQRIEILRGFYLEEDPFTSVEESDGNLVLIERNCPFQNVASSEPRLCSTTVSTLSRLLGCKVVRKQRLQNGDGRCAFHVLRDQPIDTEHCQFEFEPPDERS